MCLLDDLLVPVRFVDQRAETVIGEEYLASRGLESCNAGVRCDFSSLNWYQKYSTYDYPW